MSESLPLDAFVAGGYLLGQPFEPPPDRPPEWVPADLVAPTMWTLATCMAEILPAEWAFMTWLPTPTRKQREDGAALWGIDAAVVDALVAWAHEQVREGRVLRHHVFVDVATAREFATRFLPHRSNFKLVGLGLRSEVATGFLLEVATHGDVSPGYKGAPNGVRDGVERGVPLEPGGTVIGYEVLDVALGQPRCSWHCNHVEHRVLERLGVRAKPDGFLASLDDAERVANFCRSERVGCGSGLWRAWRVAEYALGD